MFMTPCMDTHVWRQSKLVIMAGWHRGASHGWTYTPMSHHTTAEATRRTD
jgi:hypothetical protein